MVHGETSRRSPLRVIFFGGITSHIYPFPFFKIVFERNNCKYINSYNFLEKIYREKLIILSKSGNRIS